MSRSPFDPNFDELPTTLPIFPLTGALLLPHGRLPLNIFEPRYLAMTRDALAGARLIGMVQPLEGRGDAGEPPVYSVGCAGRIVSFSETEDGRYLITLAGILRFAIDEEPPRRQLYRSVRPEWEKFRGDLAVDAEAALSPAFDRPRLMSVLKPYFQRHGMSVDWEAIGAIPDTRLIATIAMVSPLAPSEKQALLEAATDAARAQLLTALIEMAILGGDTPTARAPH
ncbi:MAG TPA: LON peptidase substrate-binding domain-containing protein [Stellaceae bacterium]|nr:LON peptidase substrate-binding domain-containing protein [Stellaceae bacterium]